MTLAETAARTHAGRKRRRNEDSFILEPPLFAVADGMGGARAGEIASQLAIEVFHEFHAADDLDPEERVAAIIQEANKRIYERSKSDTGASGMGTTITAALVAENQVAIGHVGDSRAYLLREGALDQLTQDHSLVADLMRSGRLTQEEAESHPQRSLITRALGTDTDVQVDTLSIESRAGDVVLLCSDGLTTMVEDGQILALVAESDSLDAAAKALVDAANRGGGEDNITAVLFRLDGESDSEKTENGHAVLSNHDLEETLVGVEVPAAFKAAKQDDHAATDGHVEVTDWEDLEHPHSRTQAQGVIRGPLYPLPRSEDDQRGWGMPIAAVVGIVMICALALAGAFWGLSRANFVGADEDGNIAIYQGVPWEIGGGIDLYRARYVSRVKTYQLSPAERAELLDHDLLSYSEARDRVRLYEDEALP